MHDLLLQRGIEELVGELKALGVRVEGPIGPMRHFAEAQRLWQAYVPDVAQLLDFEHPATLDHPYDRLTDRIVEWSRVQPKPVPTPEEPPSAV